MPSGLSSLTATNTDTKEIVIGTGCYRADGVKNTGTSYVANCSAVCVVSSHTIKGTCDIVGAYFYNGNGGGGTVLGEQTGTGNSVDVYGVLALASDTSKMFKLYLPNSLTRVLTLASDELREMRCYPFRAQNQQLLAQISWDLPTSAGEFFPGGRAVMFPTGTNEDATQFSNVSVATNETNSRTEADTAPLTSYSAGGQALSAAMAGSTIYPRPAGIIARVKASHRHFAVIGTSREAPNTHIGGTNAMNVNNWEDDSYAAMGLHTNGYTYINLSMGSSRMYQDWIPPYASVKRMELMKGVTDIIIGHNQNDLANRTLTQFQTDMKTFYDYWSKRGVKVWITTCDPWVQKATSTGNALDEYYDTGYPIADATTETERLAYNAWLRGTTTYCTGGSGTITLAQICDGVIDTTAAVENASSPGQWKTGILMDSGVLTNFPTALSTTIISDNTKTWPVLTYNDMLVRFTDGTTGWGYVRTNGLTQSMRCHASTTYPATQILTWGTGSGALTPSIGQAYQIWKTFTKDGIHASYWGNVAKAAVVSAYFPLANQ